MDNRVDATFLTREEVSRLQTGDVVYIIWSGGNGPHKYIIQRNLNGDICTKVPFDMSLRGELLYGVPVVDDDLFGDSNSFRGSFIGGERHHTRVWRPVE